MALNVWNQPSGYSFGTFPEAVSLTLLLPLVPAAGYGGLPPPSYDGTGHHPNFPLRNSAGSSFTRYPVNSYTDGMHVMRTDLPNARTISNQVIWDQVNGGEELDPTGYSGFMYAWGQFITHELASERTGGANISVIVPAGDTNLTPGSSIPVSRAQVAAGTGINGIAAQAINDVTGWVDGSVVYGIAYPPGVAPVSGFTNPVLIREGGPNATTGKLSTSASGRYPPINPATGQFILGDPRGTENPDLLSVQTLFIREHNWHATRLAQLHPTWSGEQIYQRARSIVIAEEQVITYKEWVPKVLGENAIPTYTGFKSDTDASIKIEFAAAALRFGHSIVSGAQDRIDEQGNLTEALTLAQAFFLTPAQFERNGGADGFLRKLAADVSNKLDVYIIEDLRNLLNDPPAALDLAATNIQRGRDLGLPSLNQMRTALGLTPYTAFNQITSDTTVSTALRIAYTNINNIDLWVGGLAENRVAGAMVGETFRTIMIEQFIKLRDGDNQWYENQPWAPGDLTWLRNATLADIILRNTDTIKIQPDVFVAVERADLISGVVTSAVARTNGVDIPATNTVPFNLNVISGSLPPGLHVLGNTITGSPTILDDDRTSSFCIRASNGVDISDRTFYMTVSSNNEPTFITPAGEIDFGTQMYALDQTYINFQLEAFDLGTAVGQKLTYFIASGDGELPPGLTLSEGGLISGFITPVLRITVADGDGTYDTAFYDGVAYDFATLPSNGYDSYIFDNVFYDFSLAETRPTSLSRNFQFRVTLTDGNNYTQRIFRIFVIGDNSFRADSTIRDSLAGLFTADSTYLRQPAFKTLSYLGTYRANNYITIPIDLYDDNQVLLRLEATNQEIFTLTDRVSLSDNLIGGYYLTISKANGTPVVNQWLTFSNYYDPAEGINHQIRAVQNLGNGSYRLQLFQPLTANIPDDIGFYIGTLSTLPPGLDFNINNSELYGVSPYQPAITKSYTFTITGVRFGNDVDRVNASRRFTLNLIGEIDSVINFKTPSSLGSVPAEYNSTLKIEATSTVPGAQVIYTRIGGRLPPGLTLSPDGEIIGRVNQFYSAAKGGGLITIDNGVTTFDANTASFDRSYTFTVQAQDQFNYSAVTKTFTVKISTPNTYSYSSIRVQPYLKASQRSTWQAFINDNSVFNPEYIYRTNDTSFGVQPTLSMVVYAGIQTQVAAAYVGAIGLNHKNKRFVWGGIKKAVAIDPTTRETVYEVVYLEMLDPMEKNGKHLPIEVALSKNGGVNSQLITTDSSTNFWSRSSGDLGADAPTNRRPDPIVTVDSTGYQTSNPRPGNYYPNSITNWQTRLAGVGASERNYLPLWMRSIQPGTKSELGFKLAVPLCYCKVGTADTILLNIKYSGFEFKNLDYTIDRYIIDSVTGTASDKYLVFRNDRITV
jgi:hypothetical protein